MKTLHNPVLACMLALGMVAAAPIFAEDGHQTSGRMEPMQMADASQSGQAAAAADSMSSGEVKKVDKGAGKITIKHGPLTNLDMPAMTMVFHAKDPSMLDQIKPGDKVSFVADKLGGQLIVTKIQVKR